jgi:predicted RNA methylase
MDCCQWRGIETRFNQKYVDKKVKMYRKNGPKKTTIQLVKAIQSENIHGMTLLDIGGGVGDIQHVLLKSGVSSAADVEVSLAYLEACKEEAERHGHANRIRHL